MLDDNRPILTLQSPAEDVAKLIDVVRIGMADYDTGLAPASFSVVADFAIGDAKPGENLAPRFREASQGVWELKLTSPLTVPAGSKLSVSVKDRQGNTSRIDRQFRAAGGAE